MHESIAAELRAIMARQRVSASSLAMKLNWKQQFLSRRLTAVVPFDVNELAAVTGELGVEPEDLFREAKKTKLMAGFRTGYFFRSLFRNRPFALRYAPAAVPA